MGEELPRLAPDVAEQLVVAASAQLLRAATSLQHPAVAQARAVLTLAPPGAAAAAAELRRLSVLPRLAAMELTSLTPADVMSEGDPIEVLRKVVTHSDIRCLKTFYYPSLAPRWTLSILYSLSLDVVRNGSGSRGGQGAVSASPHRAAH